MAQACVGLQLKVQATVSECVQSGVHGPAEQVGLQSAGASQRKLHTPPSQLPWQSPSPAQPLMLQTWLPQTYPQLC